MFEERFLRRAIELSAEAFATSGTEPFAAVVVRNGQIVGEGLNRSVQSHDPTSHGETEAIRAACRSLKTVDLRGCDLYSSCEPCALCVAAMHIAGIERLYYAAGLAESNAALQDVPETKRFTVDATVLRQECGKTVKDRAMPAQQVLSDEAMSILVAWAKKVRTTG